MISVNKNNISATIKNRYASIVYSFGFESLSLHENGSNELRFEITIDSSAFIAGFTANIDGEIFTGETKEKKEAKKEYSEAKEKDENAILISQPYPNIPNVFLISTNIDANSKISLDISIEQFLSKTRNYNQLNIQILNEFESYTFAPNYEQILFDITVQDTGGVYDVTLPSMFNECFKISTDRIQDKSNQTYRVHGQIQPNSINDILLKYKVKGEHNDSNILYDSNSKTFCHILSDVISNHMRNEGDSDRMEIENYDNTLISRRVAFVIDRSGSMSGGKWRKAIASTITALKQLRNGYDRYAIILFDDAIEMLDDSMIMASTDNISDAEFWLKSKNAASSTDIDMALEKAIWLIKHDIVVCKDAENLFMNQILFITDGEPNAGVTDTKQIILNVKESNNLRNIYQFANKISIFSFGVGSDRNNGSWVTDLDHSFLRLLSLNNNGIYKRIKQSSADTQLTEYFDILSKPILSNIDIKYSSNATDLTSTMFDTLYSGSDIIVCGKINDDLSEESLRLTATISAVTGKQCKYLNKLVTKPMNITKQLQMNLASSNNDSGNNIERIWAYLRLQEMIKQKLLNNFSNDEEALSLAMKYQFVTPWTSMIVVKQKQERHNFPTPTESQRRKSRQLQVVGPINDMGHFSDEDIADASASFRRNHRSRNHHRRCSSVAAPNIFSDNYDPNNYNSVSSARHRRDSSVPVVDLGFEDSDLLLHFEKLKVADLESELEKTLNEIDEVKLEQTVCRDKLDGLEKEMKDKCDEEELNLRLTEITQSKTKLAEKCAFEITRLSSIINQLSTIPELKDAIMLVTDAVSAIQDWREWDHLQIIKWIMSLENGKYRKYEMVLMAAMKKQNITGMNLVHMSKDDLKCFGVEDVQDCEEIWKRIQEMIKI